MKKLFKKLFRKNKPLPSLSSLPPRPNNKLYDNILLSM